MIYYFLFSIFFLYTVREIYSARDSLGMFQAPSFFGLCAPCLPRRVPTFPAFTNDVRSKGCIGTRTKGVPTVLFATAWDCLAGPGQKRAQKQHILSLWQTVGASWVWHTQEAQISRDGDPGSSDIVSPVLLICSNCMSWLQNFGIVSFISCFHCSFIPPEILTSESVLSPFLKCFIQLNLKIKKKNPHTNNDSQGSKMRCSQACTDINSAKMFVHRIWQKMTEFLNYNILWTFNITSNSK